MATENGLYSTWKEQSQVKGYHIEALNHLSAPKGIKYTCELTNTPASVKLVTPYMSLYYASKADAIVSWEGIMHKLLPLLSQLRAKPTIIGSEEERQKREYALIMSKRALIDLTRNVATTFSVQGYPKLAIPGAVQSLKFSKDVFGEDSIELVPAYLLLAQCNLGQGNFSSAQEFLGLANWSVLQNPECGFPVRSELHRTFGQLCAAQGKYQEAATHLAKDIYWMSQEVGPEHVATSSGYFYLATVFDAQHRVEAALALYDKVVDIWYKYLTTVRISGDRAEKLSESRCEEALQILSKILGIREQVLGENHIATGEAQYTLGLLRLLMDRDTDIAQTNIHAAHQIYVSHLGADHPSSKDVHDLLLLLQTNPAAAPP